MSETLNIGEGEEVKINGDSITFSGLYLRLQRAGETRVSCASDSTRSWFALGCQDYCTCRGAIYCALLKDHGNKTGRDKSCPYERQNDILISIIVARYG